MKIRFALIVLSGISLAAAALGAGKCNSDIPISWEIRAQFTDSSPNAIQGDGLYVHGLSGVDRSVINLCSNTGDATLGLAVPRQGTGRTISVNLGTPLATTSATPTWALGSPTITGNWFLNIRNIWYAPAGKTHADEYAFTTHFTSAAPSTSPGHLRMLNPTAEAATVGANSGANIPTPNSLVRVYHCPADDEPAVTGTCAGITAETWFVWPDPAAVTSLILDGKGNAPLINAGEFRIPFYFKISRLQ
ncbi:MAG: hypothetical protein ABI811_19445 [Acidobacteriota bacterium]